MSIAYGQKSVTVGAITTYTVGSNVGWVVVQNESPYSLGLSIDGTGSTRTVAAQTIDKIPIPSAGFNGNIILTPTIVLLNTANAPSFAVLLDAFGKDEEPLGAYPVALSRAVQVEGNVNTMTTSTSAIDNELNSSGTPIITSVVAGDAPNKAVYLTNDAQGNIGDSAHPANLTINGNETVTATFTVNGSSFFAAMQVFGLLQLTGASIQLDNAQTISWKDNAGTVRQVLTLSNTNKVIVSGASQFVEFRNQANTVIMSLDLTNSIIQFPQGGFSLTGPSNAIALTTSISNTYLDGSNSSVMRANGQNIAVATSGLFTLVQRLLLAGAGGLTSISTFTGTGTTTGVAHGCQSVTGTSVAPDFIMIECTAAGSTMTTGYSAVTATTCTISCGSALAWKATAFKF